MTTVHTMTNDQNLLDLAHRDSGRARAAPSTSSRFHGSGRGIGLVLPEDGGKSHGMACGYPSETDR